MTPDQITAVNATLRRRSAPEIVRGAMAQANGRAIVSTNFRPYEAVVLHLCVQAQPDIPVLWVDHGYNSAATYRHAATQKKKKKKTSKKTTHPSPPQPPRGPPPPPLRGEFPSPDDEKALKEF